MPYAIIRTQKLKGSDIKGAGMHCDRSIATRNADPELTQYNTDLVRREETLQQAVKERMKMLDIKKPRKDCVEVVELMMSASPEFFKDVDRTKAMDDEKFYRFVHACHSFLGQKFESSCIVGFSIHLDEKTPHIHAHVIPAERRDDGYILNCKKYLGGVQKMRELQDEFAKCLQKWSDRTFERGKSKLETGREHTSMKEVYRYNSMLLQAGYTRQEIAEKKKEAILSAGQEMMRQSPSFAAQIERVTEEKRESARIKEELRKKTPPPPKKDHERGMGF